jgi:hypothetical protein
MSKRGAPRAFRATIQDERQRRRGDAKAAIRLLAAAVCNFPLADAGLFSVALAITFS